MTNWTYDTTPATVDVAFYRSLMPTADWEEMQRLQCNLSGIALGDYSHATDECRMLNNKIEAAMHDIDVYNIYGPCWGVNASENATNWNPSRTDLFGKTNFNGKEEEYRKFMTAAEYTPWMFQGRKALRDDLDKYGIPRCVYALPAAEQLNSDTVRAQLNIKNNQTWRMCATDQSDFDYTISPKASQWAYEDLRWSTRMLHYSGDMDASVPTIGTERWINALGWETTKPWSVYTLADKQVAGYYQQFAGGLSLATVHGAGHMVPQDQRERAYYILFNWVFERGEFAQPSPPTPPSATQPDVVNEEPDFMQS